MTKKFKAKPFKKWLDCLASIVVKARDEYTCQKCGQVITDPYNCQWCHIKSRTANNTRWLLNNTITLCGTCHTFFHNNPHHLAGFIKTMFPARWEVINQYPFVVGTWKEEDFLSMENHLLHKAKDFDIDILKVPKTYRDKFIRKMKCQ